MGSGRKRSLSPVSLSMHNQGRETLHMWLSILIAIFVAGYRLFLEFMDRLAAFLEPHTQLPIADWLEKILFFWLLVLLWVAYRKWRGSVHAREELEEVITGISPDTLIVADEDRTILMCNSAVSPMFGYDPHEVLKHKTDILYSEVPTDDKDVSPLQPIRGTEFHLKYGKGSKKTGETFPMEMIVGDLKGRLGRVMLMRDITERSRAEKAILEAKEEAEEASTAKTQALGDLHKSYDRLAELERMRDDLTHMVVHDLKSPLSAITLRLELLQTHLAGPEQTDEIEECLHLVIRLAEMIGCLLDVSRLENNQMPLNFSECNLTELSRNIASTLHIDTGKKTITINSDDPGARYTCDPEVIERVISNLLQNAIKFTPSDGKIDINVVHDKGGVKVSVADTGYGIPEEYHEEIFERFRQVEAREFSTGLGLTFCKLAVETHGGTIGVESEVDKGSTFWFTLPAPAAEA